MADLISVIVSTYNRDDALAVTLRSLGRQTDRDFEIVVSDDGSGPATRKVIAEWKDKINVPLIHVWHSDVGFRLAEIRNRSIRACHGSYCIFLDGDCIARQDFVAAHRRLAEPGWFVAGNRVLLSRDFTVRVFEKHLTPERWGVFNWAAARVTGRINRVLTLMSIPLGRARKMFPHRWRAARGGNVAVAKRDLLAVDGFDAAFSGWGREDSDIFIRLMRHGVRRKSGRFATAVLHLWHAETDRSKLAGNDIRLRKLLSNNRVRAEKGISNLRDAAPDENQAAERS